MCTSERSTSSTLPAALPGRRYNRAEARKLILEGMMELSMDALADSFSWLDFMEEPNSEDDSSLDPWRETRGALSVYELRSRTLSLMNEENLRVTQQQFDIAAALVDEWDSDWRSLLDLALLVHADDEGDLLT